MTPIVYDGRKRAAEIKEELKKKKLSPSLAIVKVNQTKATQIFTRLKQKNAEEVGAKVHIYDMSSSKKGFEDVTKIIRYLNADQEIHGVMVQLPFPERMKKREEMILNVIDPVKDVDGMRKDSQYAMPVTLAVLDAVKEFQVQTGKKGKLSILVIGAKGFVGRDVVHHLKEQGHEVREVDRSANRKFTWKSILENSTNIDLIVTATGHAGLLHEKNVVEGVGIIDVGAPEPELNLKGLGDRLSFYTPVPGGIGPVTIAYLLENLFEAAYNQTR
jgi:methylenetetrahydrofolate dehydrogenase (NADP+) / methenyltetrahydrofolate cyclohydrolase